MNLDLNGQDLMLETQSHVYCFHQDFLYHKSLLENRLDIHFVDLSLNKSRNFYRKTMPNIIIFRIERNYLSSCIRKNRLLKASFGISCKFVLIKRCFRLSNKSLLSNCN